MLQEYEAGETPPAEELFVGLSSQIRASLSLSNHAQARVARERP